MLPPMIKSRSFVDEDDEVELPVEGCDAVEFDVFVEDELLLVLVLVRLQLNDTPLI